MSLKRIDNFDDDAFFAEYAQRVVNVAIRNLCYIGESCINIGRSTNTYKDQTGNLRNSIGYVVVCDGQVIGEKFTNEHGKEFINELVSECGKGIYLIVVAGMRYATYVSAKGLDVLDSAELEAEKLMKQLKFIKK